MTRSLHALVLAVICALTMPGTSAANPVSRHSPHPCRTAKKHHPAKRCRRRVKHHGTLSVGSSASSQPSAPERTRSDSGGDRPRAHRGRGAADPRAAAGSLGLGPAAAVQSNQGLFLEPNQFDNGPPPTVFDLRHVDIDDSRGAHALWLDAVNGSPRGDESGAILSWNVQDVYVVPNPARTWPGWWLWPQPSTGDPTWDGAIAGAPPSGTYVQATVRGATGVDEGTSPTALIGEQP